MNLKKENGITILALVITIIVMLIVAGVTISGGTDMIKKADLEGLKTNMLLIQAKAKEYVEQVDFKKGIVNDENRTNAARDEVYKNNGLIKILENAEGVPISVINFKNEKLDSTQQENCYYVSKDALEKMGLSQVKISDKNNYIIVFDEENVTTKIYNTAGFNNKYLLEEIEKQ